MTTETLRPATSPTRIADTIAAQLGGTGRLTAMIGAKNFVALKNGLTFHHMKGTGGVTFTRITLAEDDTYTVEIGKIVKYNPIVIHLIHGVYAGNLREVIESTTGLYLSLGTMGR